MKQTLSNHNNQHRLFLQNKRMLSLNPQSLFPWHNLINTPDQENVASIKSRKQTLMFICKTKNLIPLGIEKILQTLFWVLWPYLNTAIKNDTTNLQTIATFIFMWKIYFFFCFFLKTFHRYCKLAILSNLDMAGHTQETLILSACKHSNSSHISFLRYTFFFSIRKTFITKWASKTPKP